MNLEIEQLGEKPLEEVIARQMQILEQKRKTPDLPEFFLVTRHPHVYTLGKQLMGGHPGKTINEIPVHWLQRSGGTTYHGPGQLVVYAVIFMKRYGKFLRDVRHDLEEAAIATLQAYGIEGYRSDQHVGVWASGKLVAAVGLGSQHGISLHGMALNVNTDLRYFQPISPCGLASSTVSSMKALLGKELDLDEVEAKLCEALRQTFS